MAAKREQWLTFRFVAPIGDYRPEITDTMVQRALPERSQELQPVALDLVRERWDGVDMDLAVRRIQNKVDELIHARELLKPAKIGVFAIGPIPLLARLGRLLGQDERVQVFQRLRPPVEGWAWQEQPLPGSELTFPEVAPDQSTVKEVALVLAISVDVKDADVRAALPGLNPRIYRVSAARPDPNVISTRDQLVDFQGRYERLIRAINGAHGGGVRLHLFLGVPVSVAVECGRWPLQKSFASFHVYEWHHGRFDAGLDLFPARPASDDGRGPVAFVSVTASGVVGSPARHALGWDHPAHPASVSGLLMSETPVTVGDWEAVRKALSDDGLDARPVGADPSLPVVNVTWHDALRFANALSRLHGRTPAFDFLPDGGVRHTGGEGYRLPLETEWELAALGDGAPGDSGPFFEERQGRPAPVRTGQPNEHGLHDMVGNIWEWCLDPWEEHAYEGREPGVKVDVAGARLLRADGSAAQDLRLADPSCRRVVRGGGCDVQRVLVDLKTRSFASPMLGNPTRGFRLVGPARTTSPPLLPVEVPVEVAVGRPVQQGVTHVSNINIHGTNVQFIQSGTGVQNNHNQSQQSDLATRLDEILAQVAAGRTSDAAVSARLAALEGELVAYGGNVSDLQSMIEPLWTKYVTESNRPAMEVFARGLPDKAAFFVMSQALLRLIVG